MKLWAACKAGLPFLPQTSKMVAKCGVKGIFTEDTQKTKQVTAVVENEYECITEYN